MVGRRHNCDETNDSSSASIKIAAAQACDQYEHQGTCITYKSDESIASSIANIPHGTTHPGSTAIGDMGITLHDAVLDILNNHDSKPGGLIAILQDIQAHYGYLPENALRAVSLHAGYSMVDIYGLATFYKSFTLQPRGKHTLCVCMGTACHVRNSPRIVEEFERQLGIHAGQTTPDRQFTLETVNCLGACALGPIVVADGRYFSRVDMAMVKKILSSISDDLLPTEKSEGTFVSENG